VVRVRRPAGAKLPQLAGTVVDLSQLGTAGTTFSDLRDTGRRNTGTVERQSYRSIEIGIEKGRPTRPKLSRQAPPTSTGDIAGLCHKESVREAASRRVLATRVQFV
jgi:hypothetical protein